MRGSVPEKSRLILPRCRQMAKAAIIPAVITVKTGKGGEEISANKIGAEV